MMARAAPFNDYELASLEVSFTSAVVAACITAATGISLAIYSQYVKIRDENYAKLDIELKEQQDFYQRLLTYVEELIYNRSKLIRAIYGIWSASTGKRDSSRRGACSQVRGCQARQR
jgi:hypothetical protein